MYLRKVCGTTEWVWWGGGYQNPAKKICSPTWSRLFQTLSLSDLLEPLSASCCSTSPPFTYGNPEPNEMHNKLQQPQIYPWHPRKLTNVPYLKELISSGTTSGKSHGRKFVGLRGRTFPPPIPAKSSSHSCFFVYLKWPTHLPLSASYGIWSQ